METSSLVIQHFNMNSNLEMLDEYEYQYIINIVEIYILFNRLGSKNDVSHCTKHSDISEDSCVGKMCAYQ